MGRAMMRRSDTIQTPGRGSSFVQTGMTVRTSQGSAIPKPRARKIAADSQVSCVSAYPSAAPMKGAVQGEAITTARTPVQKLPCGPWVGSFRMVRASERWLAAVNSKSPSRLSMIEKKSRARMATTQGD